MADNLELITRLDDHRCYTKPYPNTTLGAEFDLTKQIHLLHTEHQLPSTFRHVKGHQDRTTEYSKLDLPAQLNCDADKLAGRYYHHHDGVVRTQAGHSLRSKIKFNPTKNTHRAPLFVVAL